MGRSHHTSHSESQQHECEKQVESVMTTLSSSTRSMWYLPRGLMSFSIKAMMMSIPLHSWHAIAFYQIQIRKKVNNLEAINEIIKIFTYLKLCNTTAIHNFKWVKISHIVYLRTNI